MKPSVITISRQYGSGGRHVGALLAEQLGIPFYDKALFAEAAQRSGIHESHFEEAEQHNHDQFFAHIFDGVSTPLSMPLNDRIFLAQVQTIRELAEKGPCILVGRGANRILKDRKDVLNVYIYADQALRIRRAVEEYGVDPARAERVVRDTDKDRAVYLKTYTDQQFGNAENYHLCIDSGAVGIENTAKIILATYRTIQ